MKTYTAFCIAFACLFISCSKSPSDDGKIPDTDNGIRVDYTVILESGSNYEATGLTGDLASIQANSDALAFETIASPLKTKDTSRDYITYRKKNNCTGEVSIYDYVNDSFVKKDVFLENSDCDLEVNSVIKTDAFVFLAYEVPDANVAATNYFVRKIDISSTEWSYIDMPLDEKPVELLFTNEKLVVLTKDVKNTNDYTVLVLNSDSGEEIHDIDLGQNVLAMLKKPDGNILISYEDMHLVYSSNNTYNILDEVRYETNTAPNFGVSQIKNFEANKKLYYTRQDNNSIYGFVPSVYDLQSKLIVLYYFENYLTEEQREFEFKIEKTTAIAYDEKNKLILIGYKKTGNSKGGLIRIKPEPSLTFIDNINLNGIPRAVTTLQ